MVQPLRELEPTLCECRHWTLVIINRQTSPTSLGLPSSQLQMWTPKHFCYFVLTCSIIGSASYSRSRKKKLTAKWNHSFSGLMSSKNCHNCPGLASLVCDWQRHQCWARCTERKADCWMFPVGSVVTLCLFKLKCSYTLHFLPSARKLTSHLGGWGFQCVPKPKGCNLSSVSCICCRAKTPHP